MGLYSLTVASFFGIDAPRSMATPGAPTEQKRPGFLNMVRRSPAILARWGASHGGADESLSSDFRIMALPRFFARIGQAMLSSDIGMGNRPCAIIHNGRR
jgi:hypothetical protein